MWLREPAMLLDLINNGRRRLYYRRSKHMTISYCHGTRADTRGYAGGVGI
jgi:hypothetical protein